MRFWKRPKKEDANDNVVELFPAPMETGQTVMMSKEQGLDQAIAEFAERLRVDSSQADPD